MNMNQRFLLASIIASNPKLYNRIMNNKDTQTQEEKEFRIKRAEEKRLARQKKKEENARKSKEGLYSKHILSKDIL